MKLPTQLNQYYLNRQNLALTFTGAPFTVDGSALKDLDSAGLAFLIYLKQQALLKEVTVDWKNMPEIFYTLCDLYKIKL